MCIVTIVIIATIMYPIFARFHSRHSCDFGRKAAQCCPNLKLSMGLTDITAGGNLFQSRMICREKKELRYKSILADEIRKVCWPLVLLSVWVRSLKKQLNSSRRRILIL